MRETDKIELGWKCPRCMVRVLTDRCPHCALTEDEAKAFERGRYEGDGYSKLGPKHEYTEGLVALHNLHIALDAARSLPKGSTGIPSGEDPLDYVVKELRGVAARLGKAVAAARFDDLGCAVQALPSGVVFKGQNANELSLELFGRGIAVGRWGAFYGISKGTCPIEDASDLINTLCREKGWEVHIVAEGI